MRLPRFAQRGLGSPIRRPTGVLAPFGILLSPVLGAVFRSASTVTVAINAQLLRRVHADLRV